ncbi:tRNA (adenosine(37)-N6)-threonylcarbamoyltransferase complex ATPase subunit type 1 TsaE [Helicobacter himalayensis]|uniref:tRNA (adenosine(37)-N6)-threonylcarbamoyltransferase complex ATPase subunit type 1 TsaE n=1 Tax=Helicobacter himalayensis TaxID=1591088 RepID=UPI003D6FEE47
MQENTFTLSEENLSALCEALSALEKEHKHIFFLLNGDLGSGKTTLVKEFVRHSLGVEGVSSPTFSLSQDYEDKVFHYDFYQKEFNQLLELGFIELFEREGVHFIEWANPRIKALLKKCNFLVYEVAITPLDSHQREYKIIHE